MLKIGSLAAVATPLLLALSAPALAQDQTKAPLPIADARPVTMEWIKVHAPSLEGNLGGEAVERDVLVVLPPSYAEQPQRRYPVVYALHGYSIGAEQWIKEIHVPLTIRNAFAEGVQEMIVVIPDSKTSFGGSMYSSSATTGDFEGFIARDLVAYVDANYRTIPDRFSRGLVGHSMGGYGTTRIGMKHPDVFSALYIMSACCLSPRSAGSIDPKAIEKLAAIKSPADAAALSFFERATLATAAAWSPAPGKPPLYFDLPAANGEVRQDVVAKWAANAPLAFVDQYVGALKRYNGIAIDVGDQDRGKADAGRLHEILNSYGIANSFEVYPGTHTSDIGLRFQSNVLPFFSRTLKAE